MSQSHLQPADSASPARSKRNPLFLTLAVLVVAVLGLLLLGMYSLRGGGDLRPAAGELTPSPTIVAQATSTVPVAAQVTVTQPGSTRQPSEPAATMPVLTAELSATTLSQASPTAQASNLSPAEQSLATLESVTMPVRDVYSITSRLRPGVSTALPRTTNRAPGNYDVGHNDTFFMSDIANRRYYTVTATLRHVTEHAYWYVEDGHPVEMDALNAAARTFDTKIYPEAHTLFGIEWSPGVDNDPRITVLLAAIPGAGGYFSSADEYTRTVNPFSNEREIIYVNVDSGWGGVESTLAHEFQHMIHWNNHPNHDVWLNEGASVLASWVNGYDIAGVDSDFMREPDTQLNAWQYSPEAARANYGASFLLFDFLRSHYGGADMVRAIVGAPGQGTDVIDNALAGLGRPERFTDVFERWVLANLLDGQRGAAEQGLDYPDREVSVSPVDSLLEYPAERRGTVSQFGTDYIEIEPPSQGTLRVDFSGQAEVPVIATNAHSGEGIWWSNRGDLADSTMTRNFDLTGLKSATLDYYIWLDTEPDLDYGYVQVSSDGGVKWDTLEGNYTTDANPNGTNYGHGYAGVSADKPGADKDGWLHESVDISKYAGKQVQVRFEYITDDGYNAGGIAIDDISIPELGYQDNAEAGSDWQGAGFVRVANRLPQHYYVAVVKYSGDTFSVQPVDVAPDGNALFDIDGPYDRAVLVISGITPHNIQKADYSLHVDVRR
jgi:immune inhibitor A